MSQSTITSRKTPKNECMGAKWHAEGDNCPCKGRPQPVSARLQGRRDETPKPGTTPKMFFRTPGSQNRKK